MKIIQKSFKLVARTRGYHLITDEIIKNFSEIKDIKSGLANIFLCHTSASLTINENADPSVRRDFSTFFSRLVPEDTSLYEHVSEGPDDMTSHIKSSIFGNSLAIPITNGIFHMGTWQGIYLCEHRNQSRPRKIVITVIGELF